MRLLVPKVLSLAGLLALVTAAPAPELNQILAERALGINCRGAGLCSNHIGEIQTSIDGIDTSKTYQNGEHIACWKNDLGTGICVFLQGTASGVQGSQIQALFKEIRNHGCKGCGSVPIVFPGSNDPKDGILTVNYVADRGGCDGICDGAKPTQSQDPPPDDPHTETFPRQVQLIINNCDDTQKAVLQEEFNYAYEMASSAKNNPKGQNSKYFDHFFDQGSRGDGGFEQTIKDRYERMQRAFTGTDPEYTVVLSCNYDDDNCTRKQHFAHANPDGGTINFCRAFFEHPQLKKSKDLLDGCGGTFDLRAAQRSRAAIIIHEASHVKEIMGGGTPSDDFAYGFTGCEQLAAGTFDRSCAQYADPDKVKCAKPDGTEGVCDASKSAFNADTYAHVAAGVFFSERCNKEIPFPQPATNPSTASAPADACPYIDDYLIIDGDEGGNRIKGHVHFGDSYASGMGTGTTSGDNCRVGSNNYGGLVHDWFTNKDSIDFERRSCSGDTVDGLNQQVEAWSNAGKANLGTVTIGGNDVGFSDLVYYCVITPNTGPTGGMNRKNCLAAEKKANEIMDDTGPDGLRSKLKEAFVKILDKASSRDFQLYVANYPTFFNEETTDCNDASFHYWWGGNRPSSDWPIGRIVYLSQDLRKELNDLVRKINQVILSAVLDADQEHGGNRVHYIDINQRFDDGNHRWCEPDVKDPDPNRKETWFFLSGWPDVEGPDTASTESIDVKSFIDQGEIKLPDGCTHQSLLDRDWSKSRDPYDLALCRVAAEIADAPDGDEAKRFRQANKDIAAGDVSSQSIPWYLPTRQIKTFHPRTTGMQAYRDAIIEALASQGQL